MAQPPPPAGVFLDKVGHYTTEALIPIVLGIRAAGWPLEFPADLRLDHGRLRARRS